MRGWLMLVAVTWTTLGAVLLISAAHHLLRPSSLTDSMAEHGVLPADRRLAYLFVGFEILLGLAGALTGLDGGRDNGAAPVVAGSAILLLLLLLVAYVQKASTNASGSGCGCGPVGSYLGRAVLARNAFLVILCMAALVAEVIFALAAAAAPGVPEKQWAVLPLSLVLGLLLHMVPVGWSLVQREGNRLLLEHTPTIYI
jgi:hypothetical protein